MLVRAEVQSEGLWGRSSESACCEDHQSRTSAGWRSDKRASVVFTLQTLFLFYRELIEMLAISRNQKLLQSGEENQVSGFFLN